MQSNLLLGSRARPERDIDSQAKPNGNMQHADARKQSTGGATSFNPAWPTARIALTSQPPSNLSKSVALSQIHLDCMIWGAESISGSRTVGTKITKALRLMVQHGSRANAPHTSFGLVPGEMMRGMSGHQTATVTTPMCDTLPTASGSHCPPEECRRRTSHEIHPADRTVCGHELSVICGVCSRKARAKGRASLFRVAAGRRDDQRRVLVPLWSAQHGRNPCRR